MELPEPWHYLPFQMATSSLPHKPLIAPLSPQCDSYPSIHPAYQPIRTSSARIHHICKLPCSPLRFQALPSSLLCGSKSGRQRCSNDDVWNTLWKHAPVPQMGLIKRRIRSRYQRNVLMLVDSLLGDPESKNSKCRKERDYRAAICKQKMVALHLLGIRTSPNLA